MYVFCSGWPIGTRSAVFAAPYFHAVTSIEHSVGP